MANERRLRAVQQPVRRIRGRLFHPSWLGNAERATGARDYLKPTLTAPPLPLDYMGRLPDATCDDSEAVEFWTGPCGANIVHIRPKDKEQLWATYVPPSEEVDGRPGIYGSQL